MPERRWQRPRAGFLASLPERAVRLVAGTVGGLVYELSRVLLPPWVRRSTLYNATVARALRITVEMVGGVRGVMPADGVSVRDLATRKAAGNALELASILAVGWSPLWLLAAASDLTGGTRTYLRRLAAELKDGGVLSDDAGIASFEDLLRRVEGTSRALADSVDLPPLDIRSLRATWESFKRNSGALPSVKRQEAIYSSMEEASRRQGYPLLVVSAVVAASALRAGFQLGNTHVFQYYQEELGAILQEGLPVYAQRIAGPYISAAGEHLAPDRPTYTERALAWIGGLRRRLPGRRGV